MKKLTLLIALLLALSLALAACGGGTTPPADVEEPAAEVEEAAEEPAAEEPAAEEPAAEEPAEEVAPTEAPAEEAAPTEAPAEEAPAEEASGDRVVIDWFVGLGTGGNAEQIEAEDAVVAAFNESQDEIELRVQYVQNEVAYDTLSTLIASGDAPDIIGPVGTNGANSFPGSWLDIAPLVESSGYDLSQFPDAAVDFYRTADGGLEGLPFAVFPAMIYYKRDLFDEGGLNYPPATVGEPYVMPDGTEAPWNHDTLRDVAMLLTVDANGNDATSADFDPENIVQWGYYNQWIQEIRALCNPFGAANLIDDAGQAVWPDSYQECVDWTFNAIWTDHFYPTQAMADSELLATPNQFGSGNVAMAQTHLWFTCCIVDAPVSNWDLAVVPTNAEGVTTSKLHADTFRIHNSTEHPEEAFTVLAYLVGEAAPALTEVYGALPIRAEDQATWFAAQDANYPQGVNWDVVGEMLQYPDIPSHEYGLPNYQEAVTRMQAIYQLINTDGTIDLNAEVETFVSDMQTIFDSAE
jgi:multiple sugar transport system substrate-binding protein